MQNKYMKVVLDNPISQFLFNKNNCFHINANFKLKIILMCNSKCYYDYSCFRFINLNLYYISSDDENGNVTNQTL